MKWSKYQNDIFEAIKNTKLNIVVNATAGSGKTTTTTQALKLIPKYKRTLLTSFTGSIVEELKKRVDPFIETATMHSIGYALIRKAFPGKTKLNDYKVLNFISPNLNKWCKDDEFPFNEDEKQSYQWNIFNLVRICRVLMIEREKEAIEAAGQKYGIEVHGNQWKHAIEAMELMDKYNENPYSHRQFLIDFIDMIELPYKMNLLKPIYDFIAVDECQDLSILQQKIIFCLLKPNGRFLAVGDPYQSIFGFIGADINAFKNFQSQSNTITLPLSVSYRCGKNIVKKAQEVNDEIQYFEGAKEGSVIEKGSIKTVKDGDFVLCRNNKPLLTLYFELLAQGKKAYVKGKDYGDGLIKIMDKVKTLTRKEVEANFKSDLDYVAEKLKEKGIEKPLI
jgi:superfamily I DNA/RNA helicase